MKEFFAEFWLWIAIPFQLAISLPALFDGLAAIEWYIPVILLATNVGIFTFIAVQIRDVANQSQQVALGDSAGSLQP